MIVFCRTAQVRAQNRRAYDTRPMSFRNSVLKLKLSYSAILLRTLLFAFW